MKNERAQKVIQAATCLVCAFVVWRHLNIIGPLEGTEFGGGRTTGSLLTLYYTGVILLISAFLLAIFFRRISAALMVLTSLLCLPLYLYFMFPGMFRSLALGPMHRVMGEAGPVMDIRNFVWSGWAALGLALFAGTIYVGLRGMRGNAQAAKQMTS